MRFPKGAARMPDREPKDTAVREWVEETEAHPGGISHLIWVGRDGQDKWLWGYTAK